MKLTLPFCLFAACLHCTAQESKAPPSPPEAPVATASSAAEIDKHFNEKMTQALEAYLATHPKAGDTIRVMEYLAYTYLELGDAERQLVTLEKQYAAMPKGANGDAPAAFTNITRRLFIHRGNNSVAILDKALEALEQGKKDFPTFADPDSRPGQTFNSLIAQMKRHSIGSPVKIAFTALDGTKVDLANMKGKVVLVVYFEPPLDANGAAMLKSVKTAYDKLHAKGFEVIGLSYNKDRAAIESFVKKEGIPWPQSYDGQGWDYSLAVRLSVNTLPFNLLVGKDGKMAVRHVRSDELEAKVAEMLK
jgi:peroxiredoxin